MEKRKNKRVILVIGISGSGKSTTGKAISTELGIPFLDADDFHPRENVTKMSRGVALTDEDRWPWLAAISEFILQNHRNEFVLACSALKESYRKYLGQRLDLEIVYLKIERDSAEKRISARKGHFMPKDLVSSQLETLEEPDYGIIVSSDLPTNDQLELILPSFKK